MGVFRQSTSRADDPQVHSHVVISAKVRTPDGRWWALDARYLKRHQRMLGGLYQSALRAGMAERFGVAWGPVVNGQAEIAGVPEDLLQSLSKRTVQVDAALGVKLAEFRAREGRDPTRWERAALTREAAADTRGHKTGTPVEDLVERWRSEAAGLGHTPASIVGSVRAAARATGEPEQRVTVEDVVDRLSTVGSTWTRADVLRAVCDLVPAPAMTPQRWAAALERAADTVLEHCVDLDPADTNAGRRVGDGRSVWIEPTAARYSSEAILAQEEHLLTWALGRQADPEAPSGTVEVDGLDVLQAAAARAVAGTDALVLVEGPAGTGKTTMLACAVADLERQGRVVFGVAPTAKAARVLEAETRMPADTLAKLLWEHQCTERPPREEFRLPVGATVIADEAGMVGTPTLAQLASLADRAGWRVVLVGDPRQLQAVGRGGLFSELCATGRVHELATIHRFTHPWEAAASLQLRAGDPTVLDRYVEHGQVTAGPFETHLEQLAAAWVHQTSRGRTVAITATTNHHVDAINTAVQAARVTAGHLDPATAVAIGGSEQAHVGEVIVTRANRRDLPGGPVRNRERWTVTATHPDGRLTLTGLDTPTRVRLPADYVCDHVRLGYAATEHGNQGATVDVAYSLVSDATTARGLYVGATRGRDLNQLLVTTPGTDRAEALDVLERVLNTDRADIPATVQRCTLARQHRPITQPSPAPAAEWVDGVDWINDWRRQLTGQRQAILHQRSERARQAEDAARELEVLQPELTAALRAWRPFQDQMTPSTATCANGCVPPSTPPPETQHTPASATLDHAERTIGRVRCDGHDTKERLDRLEARARQLHARVRGGHSGDVLDTLTLEHLTGLVTAIDTWQRWNTGHPVTTTDLVHALHTLDVAQGYAPRPTTELLAHWLHERSIATHALARSVDIDLGIGP